MSNKKRVKDRCGLDEYNIFLIILSIVLMTAGVITSREKYFGVLLCAVALFFILKAFARIMSKGSDKCKKQNDDFIINARYLLNAFILKPFRTVKDGRKYKYFICPACSSLMRLPRKKGYVEIKCPVCEKKFTGKI